MRLDKSSESPQELSSFVITYDFKKGWFLEGRCLRKLLVREKKFKKVDKGF